MDHVADRYYRNSGAVPLVGTLLMLGIGVVTAAVLSFVYSMIDFYNPLVYLTLLATAFLGLGCA